MLSATQPHHSQHDRPRARSCFLQASSSTLEATLTPSSAPPLSSKRTSTQHSVTPLDCPAVAMPSRLCHLAGSPCSPLTTPSLARLALAFRDAYQSRQFGHGCVRLRISAACDNLWSAVLCWQQRTATASLALATTKAERCLPWWNKFREGQVPNAA